MHYLKNRFSHVSFSDPVTKETVGRGEIVAFERLSKHMAARVRKRGLLEVTKEEYETYLKEKGKSVSKPSESSDSPAVADSSDSDAKAVESTAAASEKAEDLANGKADKESAKTEETEDSSDDETKKASPKRSKKK